MKIIAEQPDLLNVVAEKDAVYKTNVEMVTVPLEVLSTLRLDMTNITALDGDVLVQLSVLNPLLNFETEGKNILLIKAMPNHKKNQSQLTRLLGELYIWNKTTNKKQGELFDSGGSVQFEEGSVKMPDITYILRSKLEGTPDDKVILVVPDFVLEYVSTFDSLKEAKQKMNFYLQRGVSLGWLIVPKEQKTYIYKPNTEVTTKDFTETLSGEDVLPNFTIVLAEVFQ